MTNEAYNFKLQSAEKENLQIKDDITDLFLIKICTIRDAVMKQ